MSLAQILYYLYDIIRKKYYLYDIFMDRNK